MNKADVIIIGASAAGLMCAIEAGKRGRNVVVLDHANKAGKKILMSGGGRCNFTNLDIRPEKYLSDNPHFCKSALSRYTQWDFIDMVQQHGIAYHEKTLGQLFCDHKSRDILQMLLREVATHQVELYLNTSVEKIDKIKDHHFKIATSRGEYHCQSLVVATGGLSIPTMGASPFGYHIAQQFDIQVLPTRAGLVPFTLHEQDRLKSAELSGVSVSGCVHNDQITFSEGILFTHRGISGPAILQISSYWQPGETIFVNLLPTKSCQEILTEAMHKTPEKLVKTALSVDFPKRLIEVFLPQYANQVLKRLHNRDVEDIASCLQNWCLKPAGTEGYRTAEVTLGGVDVNALSSQTMEVKAHPGLYFIGEVLDVTGWLGGYNFQWAWSSGWVAGQVV